MLSPEQVETALAALPGDRVTMDYIRSRIASVEYLRPLDGTLTICVIRLDNGFSVVGKSGCVDPANYRQDIGEQIAHSEAIGKCWELFGFLLAEQRRHREG